MDKFIPWHLKYRPRTLAELGGQKIVERTLTSLIGAKQIPHAFLLSGSRGTGKTSTARILGASLNCEKGPTLTPCGECRSCRSIDSGGNFDLIEVDAASNNGVDDIRELIANASLAPMGGRYRIFVLDEVHMLSVQAQNAFLKTLEEPPSSTIFVLATTEPHRLLDTIMSRCLHLRFKGIGTDDIERALRAIAGREGVEVEAGALRAIATSSRGGMRDAIQLLYQISTSREDESPIAVSEVYEALGDLSPQQLYVLGIAIGMKNARKVVSCVAAIRERNMDVPRCFEGILAMWCDLMALKIGCSLETYQATSSLGTGEFERLLGLFDLQYLKGSLKYLEDAERRIATASDPASWFLATLLSLMTPEGRG